MNNKHLQHKSSYRISAMKHAHMNILV